MLPKINNITSNSDLRPVLNYAIIEGNYLIGTNAHILVKIDLREYLDQDIIDKLRPYALNKEVQKQLGLKKWETITINDNIITLADKKGNKLDLLLDVRYNQETRELKDDKRGVIGCYVTWEAVMPQGDGEPLTSISLNAKRLRELCEAISPDMFMVKMTFYGTKNNILCKSYDGKHIGLIMPFSS